MIKNGKNNVNDENNYIVLIYDQMVNQNKIMTKIINIYIYRKHYIFFIIISVFYSILMYI